MALNFPASPFTGDVHNASNGLQYHFDGVKWVSQGAYNTSTINTLNFTQQGTGAVSRSIQNKLEEFISAKDFGVTGDGTTNDTVNIQKAFDATPDNGVLVFPPGTYVIQSTISVDSKNITVQAYGAKFLIKANVVAFKFDNDTGSVVRELSSNYDKNEPTAFWNSSTSYTSGNKVRSSDKIYEAQASITGGSAPSHTTGTVNNWLYVEPIKNLQINVAALPTAPAKGTFIKIVSNAIDLYNNDSGSSTTYSGTNRDFQYRTGEWFATGSNSTTTQIVLKYPLRYTVGVDTTSVAGNEPRIDSYTTAMVARIIIPVERKITWSGGEIAYEEGHDADPWDANCFDINGFIGSRITDLTISRCYAHGVDFHGCVDSLITGSTFRNFTNNTSQRQWGYGINDTGSLRTQISNCNFSNVRHGQTTTGRASEPVASGATLQEWMIRRFLETGATDGGLVSDCTGQGDTNTVFDTHQDAHNYTFSNCIVNGGEQAFSARGQNINFIGCVANNCDIGFIFFTHKDYGHNDPDGYSAGKPEGFTTGSIRNCISKSLFKNRVTDCREVLIENCKFEVASNQILQIDSSLVKIGGNNSFKVSSLDNSTQLIQTNDGGIFDINKHDTGTATEPAVVTNVNSSNTLGRVPTSAVSTSANTITPTGGNTLQNDEKVFYNAMVHGRGYDVQFTENIGSPEGSTTYEGPQAIIGGLENNRAYFVVNRTATTFQLSHTRGGSAISFTSTGNNNQIFTYVNPELKILNGAVVEIDATETTTTSSNFEYRLIRGATGRFFTVNGTIIARLSSAYDLLLDYNTTVTGNSTGCIYWSIDGTANDMTSGDGSFFESNLKGKFCRGESLDGLVKHDWVTPDLKSVFVRTNASNNNGSESYNNTDDTHTLGSGFVTRFYPKLEPYFFLKSTVSGKEHRIRYTLNWKKTGTNDVCNFRLRARNGSGEVEIAGASVALVLPAASLTARMIVDCSIYNDSGTDKQDWTVTFLPDNGAVDIRTATTTVNVTNSTNIQFLKIAVKHGGSAGDTITLMDSEILCDLQSQNVDD